MRSYLIIVICVCCSWFIAHGQENQVDAALFQQEILIGEQVSFQLTVNTTNDADIIWPIWNDTLSEHVEIITASKIDTVVSAEDISLKQTLQLTSFDSGLWVIPPVDVIINGQLYSTQAQLLSVNTVVIDTAAAIKDIKPILEVPYTFEEIVVIATKVIGVLWVLIAIAAVIVYLIGKDAIRDIPAKTDPSIPVDIWVNQALDDLEAQSYWQNGDYKVYHVELSEVTRTYLERKFKLIALESTTFEIEQQLHRIDLTQVLQADLIQALRISDMAKFAKAEPLPHENEFALQAIRNVVKWVEQQKEDSDAE